MYRLLLAGVVLVSGAVYFVAWHRASPSLAVQAESSELLESRQLDERVGFLIQALQSGRDRNDTNVESAISFARTCAGSAPLAR
jgi:hypothetical protein